MLRLSTNMKLTDHFFIPPFGRLDTDVLNSLVKVENSNGDTFEITLSEYLLNSKGLSAGVAFDGLYYSEVLGNHTDSNLFRSLATKYIPAGTSFSSSQPYIYVTANSDYTSYHIISFEDKTDSMTEETISQAINTQDEGFTVLGRLASISSLYSAKILTLEGDNEVIWKPGFSISYLGMETYDGINVSRIPNVSKHFFLWELVDRHVPDSDIVNFIGEHYNLTNKVEDLENSIKSALQNITDISNSITTLMYQLDSTKNTVNFLANKIAEQKTQISFVQSSISSSSISLSNSIDHIEREQGSNYIKLEELSRSVQGLISSLAILTELPSRMESSIAKDAEILSAIDNVKVILASQSSAVQNVNVSSSDKITAYISVVNLFLQLINMIREEGDHNE